MDFVTTGPVLSLELMGVNSVKKWRYLLGKDSFSLKESCMYESVCVCVCVREREREREKHSYWLMRVQYVPYYTLNIALCHGNKKKKIRLRNYRLQLTISSDISLTLA